MTTEQLMAVINSSDRATYRAVNLIHANDGWDTSHAKFMKSIVNYMRVKGKLTDKQLKRVREILKEYILVIESFHVRKLERPA